MKTVTKTSSIEMVKQRMNAANSDGTISGSVMVRKATDGRAPRSRAAWVNSGFEGEQPAQDDSHDDGQQQHHMCQHGHGVAGTSGDASAAIIRPRPRRMPGTTKGSRPRPG